MLDTKLAGGENPGTGDHERRVDIGATLHQPDTPDGERRRKIFEQRRRVETARANTQRVCAATRGLAGDPDTRAVENRFHGKRGVALTRAAGAIDAGHYITRDEGAPPRLLDDEVAVAHHDSVQA